MRKIHSDAIIEAVADACMAANQFLPQDVRQRFAHCAAQETGHMAKEIFRQLTDNYLLAEKSGLPLCQDTGLAVFLVEMGQDLHVEGMSVREAINEGVRKGYNLGRLRTSMCDPFTRKNTGDNTPAVIHFNIVSGAGFTLSFMPKGGGSENMSQSIMLTPAAGWEGIRKFVLGRVAEAGPNPCPPLVLGVGIGGSFDYAPILAKKALMRKLDDVNPDTFLAEKEQELLEDVNKLGIGPMGLGGVTTALAVKIQSAPCHIASLPVALNIQCHSARHVEVKL